MAKKDNTIITVSLIIGISLVLVAIIIGFIWQKNSKDVSDRQIRELELQNQQEQLILEQTEELESRNEAKRKAYMECVSEGLGIPNIRTEDIETLRTLCSDATGFKE